MSKELSVGSIVRMQSGTEGWIKAQIVEYTDLIPSVGGGMIYTGPAYQVLVLEGKHKGQTIRVPANYVEAISGEGEQANHRREPLFPHEPKSKQPLFPHTPKGKETGIKTILPQVTIEGGEEIPPKYQYLRGFISEPLPREAE